MELQQLRYFLEVAESEHITMSAERLHIAQPALSQAIKRLEEDMGVSLFQKKGRNIVLTSCGKHLQEKLLPIIKELDGLPAELSQMADVEQHTVYLNVLAASSIITDAIIKYKLTHENINFKFTQNAEDESFDIEITTKLFYQKNSPSDHTHFVYPEKIFLAVPNNEKYKTKKSITLKEAESEDFISLMGSRQFRYICDKFCHHAEIKPNYVFESDNPAAVQNMIAANIGVGFWPEFSWGTVNTSDIKLLSISDTVCSRDILITLNKSATGDSATEFFEFLKHYFNNRGNV